MDNTNEYLMNILADYLIFCLDVH